MLIYYFLFGLLVSTTGAIAPGAVNLVVINYSFERKNTFASKVIFGATLGEAVLGITVMIFYQMISSVNEELAFAKVFFLMILTLIGIKLLISKKETLKKKNTIIHKFNNWPKELVRFLLAVINPPVLLYWIIAISFLRKSELIIYNENLPISHLTTLFLGILLGKSSILLLYKRLSSRFTFNQNLPNIKLYKTIGFLIIFVVLVNVLSSISF